jgi:hypothetical protein
MNIIGINNLDIIHVTSLYYNKLKKRNVSTIIFEIGIFWKKSFRNIVHKRQLSVGPNEIGLSLVVHCKAKCSSPNYDIIFFL